MDVFKYSDFLLLEAKKQKAEIEEAIRKMLEEKPYVKTSEFWPDEKGVYTQAGIIKSIIML